MVYISKTVTIRGGYTIDDWTTSDPENNPTTLDAQGQGRVIYITGDINPTVEGLRITGGNATGLGGGWETLTFDAGGGVYVITATVTISHNQVFSNIAPFSGGLHLQDSDSTVSGNTVTSNTAGGSGGLCLWHSDATLRGNTISGNTAEWEGGGLCLAYGGNPTLIGNTVTSNTAGSGGGLCLWHSDATLIGNTVISNTTGDGSVWGGGGVLLYYDRWKSDPYYYTYTATFIDNIISSNTADYGGGLSSWYYNATFDGNIVNDNTATDKYDYGGGGMFMWSSSATFSGSTISSNIAAYGGGLELRLSDATLNGNTIISNIARQEGGGMYSAEGNITFSNNTISDNTAEREGGGLYLDGDVTLSGNIIFSNTANDRGGGLYLGWANTTMTNNVIAGNQAGNAGSGLYVMDSSARLLHTTITRNGAFGGSGDGSGVYVTGYEMGRTYHSSIVAMTNTILVGHTVGITVAAGNTATLEGTLWGSGAWANDTDWGGTGTVVTGTVNLWGNPGFVDPDDEDYHIREGSAARDAGVDAGVTTDMDDELRPNGSSYDIGADEFYADPKLIVTKHATPDTVQPGEQLTYTITVTNTGNSDLHATITDTLPAHVATGATAGGTTILPGGRLVWTPVITAPGGVWMRTVVVTAEVGYAGQLTNLVEVTTKEGAMGEASVTVSAGSNIYLPLVMQDFP